MFAIGFPCWLLPDDMWLVLVCRGLSIELSLPYPALDFYLQLQIETPSAIYFGLCVANSRSATGASEIGVFQSHILGERYISN